MSTIRICLGLSLLAVASCSGTIAGLDVAPKPVNTQEEAASSHISVLSVARWEDYAEALQPTYALKPEDALAQAIPATMRLEEKLVDAMLARLKLAPPTSGSTSTDTRTTEALTKTAGEVTEATQSAAQKTENTATTAPGDVSALTNQALTAPKPGDLGPKTSALEGSISLDPMTRYWAATALYQEVQALNRYIRDAATRRDSLPYVVRLQVSLLPVLRGQAYDASATFAFFTGSVKPLTSLTLNVAGQAAPPEKAQAEGCGLDLPAPTVVPLLVTDSLENAVHSRTLSAMRDYGLALGMLTGGFGAGVDVQKQRNEVNALIGNDLNSLLTIGRVSDNALRVRLGAMQQANARYAMVPRTHNVTALVLVPKKLFESCKQSRALHLVSRTEVTDSVRGITLPGRTALEQAKILADIQNAHALTGVDMNELLGLAQKSDQAEFFKKVEATRFPQTVWLDLVSAMIGSRYAPATVELPDPFTATLAVDQAAAVFDDMKTSSVLTLAGGSNLLASQFTATLEVGSDQQMIPVPAQKIEILNGGRQMRLTFPSLRAMTLTKDGNPAPALKLKLLREAHAWEIKPSEVWTLANLRYLAVPPPKDEKKDKPADWTVSSVAIVSDKGKGSVQIGFTINDAAKKLTFTVEKADIASIASDPAGVLTKDAGEWKLAKSGTATIALNNLVPGNDVLIALMDEKTVVQQVRLEVQAAK